MLVETAIVRANCVAGDIKVHPLTPGLALAALWWSVIAVYLTGEALFRRFLHLGPARGRAESAGLAFASVTVGLNVGYLPRLLSLVGLLIGMLVVERRANR